MLQICTCSVLPFAKSFPLFNIEADFPLILLERWMTLKKGALLSISLLYC